MSRYDCVVIGGGHNGLVAAAYLARAGRKVCVLDVPHAPRSRDLNGIQLAEWGAHDAEREFSSWPPALAAEVAKRNILVNAVSPGFIETAMTRDLPKEHILPMIPMGRLGAPEEVAEVVRFLCSEKASYITGQVISVNGGVYM